MRVTDADAGRFERARHFVARAAVIGCALVLAVIVASAYLRLSQAGPGWSGLTGLARIVHRLAASAEALLVVMMMAVCWGVRRLWAGGALTAALIAALTVFLALLGIVTAEAQSPAVTLGNLLGGMALLGTFWSLRLQARSAVPPDRSTTVFWIWSGVVLLAFQIALGGLVSAHGGAKSCGTIPGCDGEWWPAGAAFALLDLIRAPDSFAGSALLADPARRALHMAHRFGAAILLLYWAALTVGLRSRDRAAAKGATAVAAMLLAQVALGATVVASGAAVAAAVIHNAWAALTVVAAVSAASYSGLYRGVGVSAARQTVTSK
jgi:cytochrome c oxidase assembly protein subunit 15